MQSAEHNFTQMAARERAAMGEFLNLFFADTPKHYFTRYFPENNVVSGYDCIVDSFNKDTNQKVKRYIFEIKIRNKHYPTLLFEKAKLDKYLKFEKNPAVGIYYINFTPACTVVFDLLNLNEQGKITFTQEPHNIQTADKSLGKVLKEVAFLDVNLGKTFDFVFMGNSWAKKNDSRSQTCPLTILLYS